MVDHENKLWSTVSFCMVCKVTYTDICSFKHSVTITTFTAHILCNVTNVYKASYVPLNAVVQLNSLHYNFHTIAKENEVMAYKFYRTNIFLRDGKTC